MFKAIYLSLCTAIFAVMLPAATISETFDYRFDVQLGIAKIGEMRVAANNDGKRYSVKTILRTTGLVGAFYDLRYDQSSSGLVVSGGALRPVQHTSFSNERNNVSTLEILFSGNRVSRVTYDPIKPVPAEVYSYRNTVDPGTLMYILLRPVNTNKVCAGNIDLFDGRKLSSVRFVDVKRYTDGRVECSISYSGEGGKAGVALTSLVFTPDSNGVMRIRKFEAHTSIGTLTIKAR